MTRAEFDAACEAVKDDHDPRGLVRSDGQRLWIFWDYRRKRLQFYAGRDIVHVDRAAAEALIEGDAK